MFAAFLLFGFAPLASYGIVGLIGGLVFLNIYGFYVVFLCKLLFSAVGRRGFCGWQFVRCGPIRGDWSSKGKEGVLAGKRMAGVLAGAQGAS